MKLTIDTDSRRLTCDNGQQHRDLPLYSKEAFELISRQWLAVGWDQKYVYTFSWFGRPVIQLPEDMLRMQEVIYRLKPDVIIETGVAHGGSLVFYASLCKAMGKGRVVGVDVEIRSHNRQAIEAHELANLITLVEGDSTSPATVERVRSQARPGETTLIVLDSCHTKKHVLAELEAYHPLVTPNSYIVATDGIMREVSESPRGKSNWSWDHPAAAAAEFAQRHDEFILEQPPWAFNESPLTENVTHWPSAWLRRKSPVPHPHLAPLRVSTNCANLTTT